MKLYLLSQVKFKGFNTYDSCVVVAESEEQARLIRPDTDTWDEVDVFDPYEPWAHYPEDVIVVEIGVASPHYKEPQVMCASFIGG